MRRKWWIAGGMLLLVSGVSFYIITKHSTNTALTEVAVSSGHIEKVAVAVGRLVPAHPVHIKSSIDGIVDEIYHRVGDHVQAKEPLLKLRPNTTPKKLSEAVADVTTQQAKLDLARQQLANFQRLVDKQAVSKNYEQYIEAKARVRQEHATLQQKQQALDLLRSGESTAAGTTLTSTIYAPVAGTVLDLKVDVGEPIISTESSQSATELMAMANMSDMIFKGSVSEHDSVKLQAGMKATITLAPYPEKPVEGTVDTVALQSDKLNAAEGEASENDDKSFDNGFQVDIAELALPEGVQLRSGFSATARIVLTTVDDVPTLPERVLRFEGEEAGVLIKDDSEQGYTRQPIAVGLSDGIHVQVLSGLHSGDKVIDASLLSAHDA